MVEYPDLGVFLPICPGPFYGYFSKWGELPLPMVLGYGRFQEAAKLENAYF